jgi:hypothetical protein
MPMATRRPAPPRVSHAFTSVAMDTGINIQIVTSRAYDLVDKDVQRALAWFDTVEPRAPDRRRLRPDDRRAYRTTWLQHQLSDWRGRRDFGRRRLGVTPAGRA